MNTPYLNVAAICENTNSLGPGNRFVIWVQGCCFNCYNCASPDWKSNAEANLVDPILLAELIAEYKEISGITISGGEPLLQAKALTILLKRLLLLRPDLNVLLFTGYEYKNIHSERAKQLLALTDVIIAGLYIDELNNNKGLRGSTNQEIIFQTERMISYKDYFFNQNRTLEFHIRDNEILMVGIPAKNTL